MNLKDFTYGLILLIIPLILILVIHRFYIYNKCHYNKECIKKKITNDMNNINNKLLNLNFYTNNSQEDNSDEEIEGFFGGFGDWLYNNVGGGSTNNNMSVPNNNKLNPLNSINPPENLNNAVNSNNDINPKLNNKNVDEGIRDSSNDELLNSINQKKDNIKKFTNEKIDSSQDFNKLKNINSRLEEEIKTKINNIKNSNKLNDLSNNQLEQNKLNDLPNKKEKKDEIKEKNQQKNNLEIPRMNLFKECNFYSDKCPPGFNDFGSIGLSGLDKNVMLSCGNVENTKPAKAIARIKNNALEEIIILDKGHGYNPDKPPIVTVVGGKGNGAHAEAIIDDDGYLKLIKIIHPGNFYTETPNIIIEPPLMNSNCHFCCKTN